MDLGIQCWAQVSSQPEAYKRVGQGPKSVCAIAAHTWYLQEGDFKRVFIYFSYQFFLFLLKPKLFKLGMDICGVAGEGVCSSWPGVRSCWQASSPVPQHVVLVAAAGKWLALQCVQLSQNGRLNLTSRS